MGMKVGILTVPFNNNYGGYLQCYALMKTIRSLGHEPVVINRRQNIKAKGLGNFKAFIANKIHGKKERMYSIKSMEDYYAMKGKNMYPFVEKYIKPLTQPLYKISDYQKIEPLNLDSVIVGSDQVWRPQYVPDIEEYFLKYIPRKIRKIAYAASLGSDKLEYKEQELSNCSELLKSFYSVSTREKSGQNIIKEYFCYSNVHVVLDPTMLLDNEDYNSIIGKNRTSEGSALFAYILDRNPQKEKLISILASKYSSPVYDILKIGKNAPFSSVEAWLNGIKTARFVVTDSFHGTVFSILFNRQFVVIGNTKRGNGRILDLLSLFGLTDRLIDADFKENDININNNIDWNQVNQKLELLKKQSFIFLKTSLS